MIDYLLTREQRIRKRTLSLALLKQIGDLRETLRDAQELVLELNSVYESVGDTDAGENTQLLISKSADLLNDEETEEFARILLRLPEDGS
jgi:hypothetical protein